MARLLETFRDLIFRSRDNESFDIFESEIAGDFYGWSGNTHFPLVNGQIWRQSSVGHTSCYAQSPRVFIYRSGPAIKMHVEGVATTIFVERVK